MPLRRIPEMGTTATGAAVSLAERPALTAIARVASLWTSFIASSPSASSGMSSLLSATT